MNKVMRNAIVLLMIIMLIGTQAVTTFAASSKDFKDLTGNWAEAQLVDLINLGIIDGYEDNTVRPDNLITRAEFATMLIKAMDIQVDESTSDIYFMDVKPGDWYYPYITTLKQRGIIDGYEDKTFKPGKNISRAEMISMLVRISKGKLNLSNNIRIYKDVPLTHWAYWNVGIASRAGLIAKEDIYFNPSEFVPRAEVAFSMDKMLWNQKIDAEVAPQELIDLMSKYSSDLNSKYNSTDPNLDDLSAISYGGQLETLQMLSDRIAMYKNLRVGFDKNLTLSDSKLSAVSNNMAKVSFSYDLVSKMFVGSSVTSKTQNGLLTYFLKRINDKWLVYGQEDFVSFDSSQDKKLGKLNMVWDYAGASSTSLTGGAADGLDIVSPTWFNISDSTGNVESRANKNYVAWAHDKGYHVWALVTNEFDPTLTSAVLRNPTARKKVIDKLVGYADTYKLDGINIDFENMNKADKDLFTQFMKELSIPLKNRGVILSVDVTIKVANSSWSDCYDRTGLAKVVDYVAVMTYDQHWSTSPVSGSVAQVTWVENGVKGMLSEVPREKLLLGLPFYTREWKEVNGVTVSSEAISMADAKNRIARSGAQMTWDIESGQYYAEYAKNGATYKIWLEDGRSIDLKAQLVNKYGLAGVASWKAGLETDDIWTILSKDLGKS